MSPHLSERTTSALSDAESGFGDAGEQDEEFGKQLDETGKVSEDAEGKLGKIGTVAADVGKALGTAAVAAGKQLCDMAYNVASASDAIDKTSQKIGISAEAYQEWSYVFERSGADVNNLQTGMKKLATVVTDAAEGSDSAAEKLPVNRRLERQKPGRTAFNGNLRFAGHGFRCYDLLGKSAVDMAAVLNMTAEDTEALKQEARDYGIIMSNAFSVHGAISFAMLCVFR